ncbi:MAG: adaptor protein MecA [Lachnospiraceae bacterium]|nr:adaptor protein MecA [Lachnospiraceae bacterium]
MRIEKINDRQIRCTLTSEDLASRNINIKELAYGSDKARELFQDMMEVAASDFGFEADNIPLVIEAIPVSMDTIVLLITKVEDPEELDTRFARFSPEAPNAEAGFSLADLKDRIEGADDILDLIKRLSEGRRQAADKTAPDQTAESSDAVEAADNDELPNLMRVYSFHSLDDAIRAAGVLDHLYDGPNTLYKSQDEGVYYLVLKKDSCPAAQFNKICNILSEYAFPCHFAVGMEAHFREHFETILAENALQSLRELL